MRFTRWCAPLLMVAAVATGHDRPALVTVSTSEDHAVEGGRWYSLLKRTGNPWSCASKQEAMQCVEHAVVVDNQSPQTLECVAGFAYQTADGTRVNDPDMPAVILPRTSHEIRGRITAEATKVDVDRLDCRARAPYQRIKAPEGCKFEMSGNPLEGYYPPAAVRLALEGPVTVSFLLEHRSGPPSEVAIADSSLVPMLDEAAKRFVNEQRFSTGCAGQRFDVRVRFTLRDRYLESPTG